MTIKDFYNNHAKKIITVGAVLAVFGLDMSGLRPVAKMEHDALAASFSVDICQRYEYAKSQMEVARAIMINNGETPSEEFLRQLAFYTNYIKDNC